MHEPQEKRAAMGRPRSLALVLAVPLLLAGRQGAPVPLLRYLDVGARRVMFESPEGAVAKFRYVDQALGPARPRDPHGATPPQSACYRPRADSLAGAVSLLFEGDEMGDEEDLTEFEVIPRGTRPQIERGCVPIAVAARAIVTDRGVRLGLTRTEVDSLLGKPARVRGAVAEYERTTERTVTNPGGGSDTYDLFSSLTVTFRRNRVVAFSGALGSSD